MNEQLLNLEPKIVWKNFVELTKIPRPSKKEGKIIEFMRQWGKDHSLETIVDEVGNVIIRKPATQGMENRKGVILQGHLDMVPQKNSNKIHDFEKDPITAYVDGDWVTADGTTLGADNGMGVALAMALLESKDIPHPPLEALFTINEEDGMTGAKALKEDILQGEILINLDSEEEGALCIGCAGGTNANIEFYFEKKDVPVNTTTYKLFIKGLKGGHSGVDIHLQRANAAKLLFRFLFEAKKKFDLNLSGFEAGNMRNAIPREGWAVVTVETDKAADFETMAKEFEAIFQKEYKEADENLQFGVEKTDTPAFVIDTNSCDTLINAIEAMPNGIIRMSQSMPGVVETSTNLSIVKLNADKIEIVALIRSSVESARDDLINMTEAVYKLANANKIKFEHTSSAWQPDINSDIVKVMNRTYQNIFSKQPTIYAVHAGLECGLFIDKYPKLQAISIGPTIKFPHSPDEKIEISTVQKIWNFLIETLKNIPE